MNSIDFYCPYCKKQNEAIKEKIFYICSKCKCFVRDKEANRIWNSEELFKVLLNGYSVNYKFVDYGKEYV